MQSIMQHVQNEQNDMETYSRPPTECYFRTIKGRVDKYMQHDSGQTTRIDQETQYNLVQDN